MDSPVIGAGGGNNPTVGIADESKLISRRQTMAKTPESKTNLDYGMRVLEGVNGLPKVLLTHPSGTSAEVYMNGAHVTSWKTPSGEELLFLSRRAWFEPGKPIRGGIPIVFPQFSGQGPLPQHGLVRTIPWELMESSIEDDDTIVAQLCVTDTIDTRTIWPHAFELCLKVRLETNRFILTLRVHSAGEGFDFQTAFHTYFRVTDITKTCVHGLDGSEFLDALRGYVRERESREMIRFAQETDRIYVRTGDQLVLEDAGSGSSIVITKQNMPDVVLWNPWVDKSRRMQDFADDEYLGMVCVETGVIEYPVHLTRGDTWEATTTFSYHRSI